VRNCTRTKEVPFEFRNQVLISSHCNLLDSAARCAAAETPDDLQVIRRVRDKQVPREKGNPDPAPTVSARARSSRAVPRRRHFPAPNAQAQHSTAPPLAYQIPSIDPKSSGYLFAAAFDAVPEPVP
jgi:hypothetical protein